MIEPFVHLAYAPRGAGLLYLALWAPRGDDVLGWYVGERDGLLQSRYFWLERYFVASDTRFSLSSGADAHGPWEEPRLGRPSVLAVRPDEATLHELTQAQERAWRHWLFADDGSQAASRQAEALRARDLPVRGLNPRPDRLGKLVAGAALWRYDTPSADRHVLDHLSRRWSLEHRVDA